MGEGHQRGQHQGGEVVTKFGPIGTVNRVRRREVCPLRPPAAEPVFLAALPPFSRNHPSAIIKR
jgi:hypothetical protein